MSALAEIARGMIARYEGCSGALYEEIGVVCSALLHRERALAEVAILQSKLREQVSATAAAAHTTEIALARLAAQEPVMLAACAVSADHSPMGGERHDALVRSLDDAVAAWREARPS